MDFFDGSKSIVENAYYISNILLFFVFSIGLYQIIVTIRNNKIRIKREAASFAAKQIEIYLNQIIPLINKFDELLTKEDLPK